LSSNNLKIVARITTIRKWIFIFNFFLQDIIALVNKY